MGKFNKAESIALKRKDNKQTISRQSHRVNDTAIDGHTTHLLGYSMNTRKGPAILFIHAPFVHETLTSNTHHKLN